MIVLRNFSLVFLLFLVACASKTTNSNMDNPRQRFLQNERHYSLAIYNQDNRLISFPLEELFKHVESKTGSLSISDIFIVAHGWNYTIPEALDNYNRYIEYIDTVMEQHYENEKMPPDFHPYFIFVTWHSITRPITEIISATLPFGLDRAINDLTQLIDTIVFQIPTAWKQSLNAYEIGSGSFRAEKLPDNVYDIPQEGRSYSTEQGRPVPLSMLLYRLLTYNVKLKRDSLDPPKLHIIGHSYGGKLAIAAAMRTLVRLFHGSENSLVILDELGIHPFESLVLINPALTLEDIAVGIGEGTGTLSLLRSIRRKAILYSNYDYPNGSFYSLSQIPINGASVRIGEQIRSDLFGGGAYTQQEYIGQKFNALGFPKRENFEDFLENNSLAGLYSGLYALFWTPIFSVPQWTFSTLIDLPYDFVHHITFNDSFDGINNYIPGIKFPLNALHFFLPLDQLYPLSGFIKGKGDSDKQGLYRPTLGALGRTGLNRGFSGRYFPYDQITQLLGGNPPYHQLKGFTDKKRTDIDAETFCQLAIELGSGSQKVMDDWYQALGGNFGSPIWEISSDKIYSFNASGAYSSWKDLIVGAHGDLNSQDEANCLDTLPPKKGLPEEELPKIEYTFNFLYNFTQVLQTENIPVGSPIRIIP